MRPFILSLFLTLFLLLIIFQAIIFNLSFYDLYYESTGLYNYLPQERLLDQTDNVLKYVKGQQSLNQEFFKEIEILHLADIKKLVLAIQIKTIGLALAFFFLFKKWRSVSLLRVSVLSAIEVLLAALLIFFLFEPLFLKFHELIFTNDFWMLDPQIHLLIVLFPPELFFRALVSTFSIALIITLISLSYLTWGKFRTK